MIVRVGPFLVFALLAPSALAQTGELPEPPRSADEERASEAPGTRDGAVDETPDAAAGGAGPSETDGGRGTLFGRPIVRDGFHFHASLGVGVGPDVAGLYHAMELGWSFSGYSVSLLHTLVQCKNVFSADPSGPDEIGGFMLQLAGPLFYDDLVWKVASGVGGTVDQPPGQFNANPGFGVHYGVDLHYPIWERFGPTLSIAGMNVFSQGEHHFAAALALGITVF